MTEAEHLAQQEECFRQIKAGTITPEEFEQRMFDAYSARKETVETYRSEVARQIDEALTIEHDPQQSIKLITQDDG